jgi:MFS transporter, DHA2 family, methylenomycin A resistance protein
MRAPVAGCAGILIGALDFGFMTIAGPAIGRDLALGDAYPWLFSASSFSYGATLMLVGWLVDRHGARTLFRAGSAVYAGALVLIAFAPDSQTLLAGRTLLGAGGGAILPAALALLSHATGHARGSAFATSGGAVAAGFVGGVLLGSLAVGGVGWRPPVLALCPAVLLMAALTSRSDAVGPVASRTAWAPPRGVLAIAGSAVMTAAALSVADRAPAATAAGLGFAAAVALAGVGRAMQHWIAPDARLASICTAGAATTASGVGGVALLGLALPVVGDLSVVATGLLLATFGVAVPLAVPVARGITTAVGAGCCCGAGLAVQGMAFLALAALPLTLHLVLAAAVALCGAGHVMANAGASRAAMDMSGRHPGAYAGLLATAQYVGAGVGALAIVGVAGTIPDAAGVRAGLFVAAVIALAGALIPASRDASRWPRAALAPSPRASRRDGPCAFERSTGRRGGGGRSAGR